MDLQEVSNIVKEEIVNSSKFPFRSGQLKRNFIDLGSDTETNDTHSFTVLSNPIVNYGHILEERASIRYRTKNHFIRHKNKHYKYIERIVEADIIPAIEREFGVRYGN